MNTHQDKQIREYLVTHLVTIALGSQDKFRRMYAHNHPEWSMAQVVASMPRHQLKWAQTQLNNCLDTMVARGDIFGVYYSVL
jgi:hypothetical protein